MPITTRYAQGLSRTQGIAVLRPASSLPQTTTTTVFTVTGDVEIVDLYGTIGTAVQAQANAIKFRHTPTGGTIGDVSGTVDINGAAAGSKIQVQGPTIAGAVTQSPTLSQNTGGLGKAIGEGGSIRLSTGNLGLNAAASSTGTIALGLRYRPLTAGAKVVPA